MDNYIKTIINGLKTWAASEIELLKNTIARMVEKCKSIKEEVAQTTAKVETLSNLQVVECDIIDEGGPESTYVENWGTIDWEAPFIIFSDSNDVIVGAKVCLDPGEETYYLGMSSRGRPVRFDLIGDDMVYCSGAARDKTLVSSYVVDNLDQEPLTNQPYVLSANQGYELQKQITALTARLEALEQEVTT